MFNSDFILFGIGCAIPLLDEVHRDDFSFFIASHQRYLQRMIKSNEIKLAQKSYFSGE
jgi:hypothetical protein